MGSASPDLALRDQHGRTVRSTALRGSPLVLCFLPFAFSRVCTGELQFLREQQPLLESEGANLLAITCDAVHTLRAAAEAEQLSFPLLSDFWPHGEVASAYGVLDPDRGCPTRSTYVVDGAGTVRWQVHQALPDARRLDDHLAVLRGLRQGLADGT